MKEIYRSFEGKLDLDIQHGYIIYDCDKYYQIEFLSIESYSRDKVRIAKDILSEKDFDAEEKISQINIDILHGCYNRDDMQVWYKDKWYSGTRINSIQNTQKDYYWQKYV